MCDLPERSPLSCEHNSSDYQNCMDTMYGLYVDQRRVCEAEQGCNVKLQCEADAWSLYETLAFGCGLQYPDGGNAPDCLLTAMAEGLMRGGK